MPNDREKDDQPIQNEQSTRKEEDETSGRRRTGLRKSESKKNSDNEGTLLGRVFRKRKPAESPQSTVEMPPAPEAEIIAPVGAEDVLAKLSWRPRTSPPPPPPSEAKREPRREQTPRPRSPKSREKPHEPKEAPIKPETAPKRAPKKEPAKQIWESVRVPEDAAQVIDHGGVPTIVHKKTVIPPLFLTVPLSSSSKDTVLDEFRMAADKGARTVCVLMDLVIDSASLEAAIEEVQQFVGAVATVEPECRVILRASLQPQKDWEKTFKRAVIATKGESGPSISDDEYWNSAAEVVRHFVKGLAESSVGERIIGVHLDNAGWIQTNGSSYDASPAGKERFGLWLRHRYRDERVALQAAWYDGHVDFDTIAIPPPNKGDRGEEFVRIGRSGRRWVDYNLFLSDMTAERIAQLAFQVKSASGGKWLVGINYGSTFECSYPSSGQLSLGKLLRCPNIDYFTGPTSYTSREPGASAPFPGPIDSFALNGKLFIAEEDFRTPISGPSSGSFEPPLMKTPQALESAHWRGAGAALAHGSGCTWIDLHGEGWLHSEGIWQRAAKVRASMLSRYAAPTKPSDVAVLIDERSLAYLVDPRAFEVLVQNVRESVMRSGLSTSFYLMSDLAHRENFPEARLYVFLNAWDIRPEVRSAIKTRLQRDDKVLFWLYCAGLFEAGRDALERVREVTGIALKPQPFNSKPGTHLLNVRHPLCSALPAERMAGGGQLEPSYFALPEDGTTFGEYLQTGLPSFVIREFQKKNEGEEPWKSVFLGEPVVTPGLFRALGQLAGAHVWNFDDDVVHVKAPYVTIHCKGTGPRTITLPNNWAAYDVMNGEWATVEANSLRFNALDGATYVFYVGIREDIELRIQTVPDSALTLEAIPPRPEDTVHWDSIQFDVEIMKLDEWVEENWTEQHADDFLLKPSLIDVEEPEDDEAEEDRPMSSGKGRRRGTRRGRRPRGRGAEETSNARKERADIEFEDAGLGVMFRKKS